MSATVLDLLQGAVYARLTADLAVTSRVTGVFDAVPDNQPEPYIVLGDVTEVPNKAFARGGHECTMTLHLYDLDGRTFAGTAARGYRRLHQLLGVVVTAIEAMADGPAAASAIAGHVIVEATYEFAAPMKEQDDSGGVWRHIPARFRLITEDAM